jgi:hypothetical protein
MNMKLDWLRFGDAVRVDPLIEVCVVAELKQVEILSAPLRLRVNEMHSKSRKQSDNAWKTE